MVTDTAAICCGTVHALVTDHNFEQTCFLSLKDSIHLNHTHIWTHRKKHKPVFTVTPWRMLPCRHFGFYLVLRVAQLPLQWSWTASCLGCSLHWKITFKRLISNTKTAEITLGILQWCGAHLIRPSGHTVVLHFNIKMPKKILSVQLR